jgi:hypothetical protein
LQCLCVALAGYVGAARSSGRGVRAWTAVSAVAWLATTVAYPPLATAAVAMGIILLAVRGDRRRTWNYLAVVLGVQAAGWAVVVAILSPGKLLDGVQYVMHSYAPGGPAAKVGRAAELLSLHPWFTIVCGLAICLGVARLWLPAVVTVVATGVLVALLFAHDPALFIRSHDVVTVLALSGVGLVRNVRTRAAPEERLVAVLYTVSLIAGVTTMAFATYSLFNFCIGAALAAAVALVAPESTSAWLRGSMVAVGSLAIAGVLMTSLGTYYGDGTRSGQARHRIEEGVYRGIEAGPQDIQLLATVQDRLEPLLHGQEYAVYVGRNPGLMLATDARLQMLSSYPIPAPASLTSTPRALEDSATYYSSAEHRPPLVMIYKDPAFTPANPFGPRFEEWYALSDTLKTPLGVLEIYRRR